MATKKAGSRATAAGTDIPRVLKVLAETPKEIARMARGRSVSDLHRKPAPDAWSAQEIVAHLRACADVWTGSIERMLAESHPTIRYVSPRGWINKTDYLEQPFADSFRAFTASRDTLLETLGGLDAKGWARGATFTGTTAGREGTVLIYATRIADHEVRHLDQLRRTIGGRVG